MIRRKILIIDGHPDPDPARFVHALAKAYADGAAKHEVRRVTLAEVEFPLLRSTEDWREGKPPEAIAAIQRDIVWAEHIVIFFPLWLGDAPALLRAFLEQSMRPGFALEYGTKGFPKQLLKGRTARIVVTMGMPAMLYRLYFRAHSIKSLARNILRFVGIHPVACSVIGSVEGSAQARVKWIKAMEKLGAAGK